MIASAIYLVFLPTVLTFIVTESGDIEIVEGRHADFPCVLDAGVHGDGNGTEVEWTWRPAMRTFLAREWRVVSQHSNKSRFTFAVTGNVCYPFMSNHCERTKGRLNSKWFLSQRSVA